MGHDWPPGRIGETQRVGPGPQSGRPMGRNPTGRVDVWVNGKAWAVRQSHGVSGYGSTYQDITRSIQSKWDVQWTPRQDGPGTYGSSMVIGDHLSRLLGAKGIATNGASTLRSGLLALLLGTRGRYERVSGLLEGRRWPACRILATRDPTEDIGQNDVVPIFRGTH